jgi:hypothetical protein
MLENEISKAIPFSGGQYFVTVFGDVVTKENVPVKTKLIHNKKFVKLDWYDGIRYYEIAIIMIIAFYNVKLPVKYWNSIEAIYDDKDFKNTGLSNISYRFKDGPIKVETHPGFFYIPYYTRYAINSFGELLDIQKNYIKNWLINTCKTKNRKSGYRFCSARIDTNTHRFISRHRAIGLVFCHYDKSPFKLVVNHKDGIPGNDIPENLEWVTYAENNLHAYANNLFFNKTRKVLCKNFLTKEIKSFVSLAECARAINRTESFVAVRLKRSNILYDDNLLFKIDDGSEWPEVTRSKTATPKLKEILIRNIFTNVVILVENRVIASKETGVSAANIGLHCKKYLTVPCNGYNFRYFDSCVEWPEFSEKDFRILRKFPFAQKGPGVVVYNDRNEEIHFFESIKIAADYFNLPVKLIVNRCKEKCFVEGKLFKFHFLGQKS